MEQWAKDVYSPKNPFQRLICLFLNNAVRDNADCIIIGIPPKGYEIEGNKEPQIRICREEDEIQFINDFFQETQIHIDETEKSNHLPLKGSPVERLPIWHCSQGKCRQQEEGILLYFFNSLIDALIHNDQRGIDISEFSEEPTRVFYTIKMEENFCFSLTIDKIEKKSHT